MGVDVRHAGFPSTQKLLQLWSPSSSSLPIYPEDKYRGLMGSFPGPHLPYETCHMQVKVGGDVKPFLGMTSTLRRCFWAGISAGEVFAGGFHSTVEKNT